MSSRPAALATTGCGLAWRAGEPDPAAAGPQACALAQFWADGAA
jgi:hypothetical protein